MARNPGGRTSRVLSSVSRARTPDSYPNFTAAYRNLLKRVLVLGEPVSPRQLPCREVCFVNWSLLNVSEAESRLDFSKTQLPDRQPIYDRYADRELEWYLTGSLDAASAPSKFWSKIADQQGRIVSNYGHMVMFDEQYPGGLVALDHVVKLLRKDPDSRQAIIHYNQPKHYRPNSKDVPCTLTAQVLIRKGRLSMWVTQRSCDMWLGLPYDVPWHCYLIRALSRELGVTAGEFHHSIGSLHLYEKNVDEARKVIADATT